ncbi:MAG: long-chain fatty acid--CoA ligase [Deltaproteobacteria bacterium HGW-Deltaproteobacteria-15]|jgi:acyl-CoA synthetase (AMP-forming)/AMP-acid ligase II|nr:MAG: long-chain fatty acid--CoA ligase [Deltaproteobacteria bacterium HGW-Deltaproteobacteria-15]
MLANLGRIIGQNARQYRERPALVNIERGRSFSYGQMHLLTNRMSHVLTSGFGLRQGDVYVNLLENDHVAFFHPWMFKCPVTGGWIDVRESLAEQLKQIDHVQPRVAFVETRFLDAVMEPLLERGIDVVCMDPPREPRPRLHYFWDLVGRASDAEVDAEFAWDDAASHVSVLRFTGGTTGAAKCAMYTPANFWAWGMNPAHYLHTVPFSHPRALLFSPINHAASGSVVIPVLLKGGTLYTLNRADVELIAHYIQQDGIELIYTVPTVLYRMLDLPDKYDFSSLKTIRYGAAPISPSKLELLLNRLGPIFVQGYGSTECWPSCTILAREDHRVDSVQRTARLASVGRPFPGEEILLCDDSGRPVPPGSEGELYIRGANTIQGYYKATDLTGRNFTSSGFWKSGDLGYCDDEGYLFLVDRKKDMIITGGYNVYATEVENCLNSHPGVSSSAVVGVPDEEWGEAVCALVMLREGAALSPPELTAYCKKRLAGYKVPKRVEFVDSLPVSAVGKVLRREVRRHFQAPPRQSS